MRIQYYRTWIGFAIPVQPDQPVDYGATENDLVVYRGTHNERDQLVQFTKRRRNREPAQDWKMPAAGKPGERLFLRDEGTAIEPRPGKRLSYEDTAEMDSYFEGSLGDDGTTAHLTLVRQPIIMSDEYIYDRDELIGRTVRNPDGKITRMAFADGKLAVLGV